MVKKIYFMICLFSMLFQPVLGFVKDFSSLSPTEKDKIFRYAVLQFNTAPAGVENAVFPYHLKDIVNSQGASLLQYAVDHKMSDFELFLIRSGVDVNHQDHAGNSPLHIAVFKSDLPSIQLLLNNNADINIANNNGQTPLITCTHIGSVNIASYLLSQGANINDQDNNGFSSLIQAVIDQNNDLVDLYIKNHADVNARTNLRRTALHFAVQTGNVKIVQKLVQAGANVNARDYDIQDPKTPLNIAYDNNNNISISNASKQIQQYLLDHHAKPAQPYYENNFSLSAIYEYASPIDARVFGANTKTPITIQYTGVNLRYYIQSDFSLSWTYAYGFLNQYSHYHIISAPGSLLGIQDLFAFLQIKHSSQLHSPGRGIYYALMGLSAILPEGISWDIHAANTPFMSYSIEIDLAKAHYLYNNKSLNLQLTGEVQGRLNFLIGEHFLIAPNVSVGVSYTQLAFVWGVGISIGALF